MLLKTVKDVLKYVPGRTVNALVSIFSIPLLTRLLSPEEYGQYVLIVTGVSLLTIISTEWLIAGVIRYYPPYHLTGKISVFSSSYLLALLLGVGLTASAASLLLWAFQGFLPQGIYHLAWVGLLLFILSAPYDNLINTFRAAQQPGWNSWFLSLGSVLKVGFGVLLIISFVPGPSGLLWGAILALAVLLPFLVKASILRMAALHDVSQRLMGDLARYGSPMILIGVTSWILTLADRYILGAYLGSAEVGIYQVAITFSEKLVNMLYTLIMLAAFPILVSVYEKEGRFSAEQFTARLLRYYIIIFVPIVVIIALLSRDLMTIAAPQGYTRGSLVIPVLAAGSFFLGWSQYSSKGFELANRTGQLMVIYVAVSLVSFGGGILLVKPLGAIGVAFAFLVGSILLCFIPLLVSRPFFRVVVPIATLWRVAAASLMMGCLLISIRFFLPPLLRVLVKTVVGMGSYLLVLFSLGEVPMKDLKRGFLQLVPSRGLRS